MERRLFLRGAGAVLAGLGAGLVLPTTSGVDRKFGRHVEHDPRSWGYRHPGAKATGSVLWDHRAPVLDQGELGSCTGNALAQFLNTDYAQGISGRGFLNEADAVRLYALATELDGVPGYYPEVDTGSTGVAVGKAGVQLGYLSGYLHAFGFDHFLEVLRSQPVIVGTVWTSAMMYPEKDGLIRPFGYHVGGHEYLALGADMDTETLTFLNSWSALWGANGRFKMGFSDFEKVLNTMSGDVTAPTPI